MSKPPRSVDLDAVRSAAARALDPELRRSISEVDLLDDVTVDPEGRVTVCYHMTSPLCPVPFAVQIGRDVRRRVEAVDGVTGCQVAIQEHFIAREIQDQVNRPWGKPSYVRRQW